MLENDKRSPYSRAGAFSRLYCLWMYPLLLKGRKRDLQYEDMYSVVVQDSSEYLGNRLDEEWKKEKVKAQKHSRRPSLLKSLFRIFHSTFIVVGLLLFVEECVAKIAQAVLLGYLLRYFTTNEDYTHSKGYVFAVGLIFCSMYYVTSHHRTFFAVYHLNLRMRTSVSSLIYRKALKLSQSSVSATRVGKIVNIMSDLSRFDNAATHFHYIWISFFQLIIIVAILWTHFGAACLAGIICLCVITPFEGILAQAFGKYHEKVVGKTDKRIMLMNEILNGLRAIKLFAWESAFSDQVKSLRKEEINLIQMTYILRAINLSLYYMSSKLMLLLTLVAYVLQGHKLSAENVFVAMALFQSIRQSMAISLPSAVSILAELIVCCKRIEEFLNLDECGKVSLLAPEDDESIDSDSDSEKGPGIVAENISAQWNTSDAELLFSNVSFEVSCGELLMIVGTIGSGKSSLLQIILGELPVRSGNIRVIGKSIAYVAQEPWIQNGRIVDNILFGLPYDEEWYQKVVEACSLERDIQLFQHGDNTFVGDKGASLSGGQKARISLARAVYANADILIFDDVLSALDAEVAKNIMMDCICGLLQNKVRVLVTHQIQFLSKATEILLLKEGKAVAKGTYEELVAQGINFAADINTSEKNRINPSEQGDIPSSVNGGKHISTLTLASSLFLSKASENPPEYGDSDSTILINKEIVIRAKFDDGSTEGEVPESPFSGRMGCKLYWIYFHSGTGIYALLLLLVSFIGTQVMYTGSDYFLQLWITLEEIDYRPSNKFQQDLMDFLKSVFPNLGGRDGCIAFYSILIVILMIATIVRTFHYFIVCGRSSIALHWKLFNGVIRSPMYFFENTPTGRILNRFSKDIDTIDTSLPYSLFDTVECVLQALGVLVIVAIVNPIFLIPAGMMLLFGILVRQFFQRTARNIKHLEGTARSPIFAHLSTTLNGLATIRSFHVEDSFIRDFNQHLDLHSSIWFLYLGAARWLGVVVDWISVLYTAFITIGALLLWHHGKIDPELAGLAITSAISITRQLQWGFRQLSDTENSFLSVQRILEYSQLAPEAELDSYPGKKPPPNWPQNGAIEFKNLSVRHGSNAVPFLHDISFVIKPREKIGIVGRSGAGKTTLISALFRLSEPEGSIVIDGINVLEIGLGLHDLRRKISIIPQEPVLFLGSLRYNLDPFHEFEDSEIWNILQEVNLYETVKKTMHGLDANINEGGQNLSLGERQLLCLGRAILRNNKILVMDEATASCDAETDALIQKSVKIHFANCTVLIVAHRLHTIIDCDRVLVMDAGTISEFDEPYMLLKNKKGIFYHLVQETGPETSAELIKMARDAAKVRYRVKKAEIRRDQIIAQLANTNTNQPSS